VVATCGTALTPTHAGLIKRHAERVYTLFDSDSAGKKATIRSMELFLEQRIPAYVITLPAGDDPDSFMAGNTVEAFTDRLKNSRPAFEFFVRSLLAETPPDSVDNKVRAIDEIVPRFRKIADPIERDLYEKEICRLMGITAHAFRKRMSGMSLSAQDSRTDRKGNTALAATSQETLLAVLINYPEARSEVVRVGVENMFHGSYLDLARMLLDTLADREDALVLSNLADRIENPEQKTILSRILVSDGQMADIEWRDVFKQCSRSREKRELSSIKDIALRLAVLEAGSEEYALLLKQADALRSRKSKL
jgi:DNA primase